MKRAQKCSYSLCNKLYTYLYHHIFVLDKYIHSSVVYYKHNGDDETYDCINPDIAPHFVCLNSWKYIEDSRKAKLIRKGNF